MKKPIKKDVEFILDKLEISNLSLLGHTRQSFINSLISDDELVRAMLFGSICPKFIMYMFKTDNMDELLQKMCRLLERN